MGDYAGIKTVMVQYYPSTLWENSSSLLVITVPNPLLGYRPLPMVAWDWYRVKLGSLISLLILIGLVFSLQEGAGHVVQVQFTEQ